MEKLISDLLHTKDMNLKMEWNELSLNPLLTIDIILKYFFFPDDKGQSPLSEGSKGSRYGKILIPWNWYFVSFHQNITWEIIQNIKVFNVDAHKKILIPWDWRGISRNPNITIDIILKYKDFPWDWFEIGRNPNITIDMILKNKYFSADTHGKTLIPWDWYGISIGPNITLDIIHKNKDLPWDLSAIKINPHIY